MNKPQRLNRVGVINSDDVMTVGELIDVLKLLDPNMWLCATIEGHAYPLTVCNAGVLETNKSNTIDERLRDVKMFFLDISHGSFMDFLEKEIIEPMKEKILQ